MDSRLEGLRAALGYSVTNQSMRLLLLVVTKAAGHLFCGLALGFPNPK